MAYSLKLEEFKANLQDVTRPNRFAVQFFPPGSLVGGLQGVTLRNSALYFAKAVNLPGRTITEYEVKHLGLTRKMPGEPTFENLTVTFWSDYGWRVRSALETWMNKIADVQANTREYSQSVFAGTAKVHQLGRKGESIRTIKLNHVWPTQLGDMDLSHDTTDQAGEFQAIFSYSSWESESGGTIIDLIQTIAG